MSPPRAASLVLTAAAIALVGAMAGGCGNAGQADSGPPPVSRAYTEVVAGLKEAALSNRSYDATRHSKGLTRPERAVVDGFCEFAWQIPVNHLVHLLDQPAYVVPRITHLAELGYRGVRGAYDDVEDASIKALMERLERIVDLGSLDGKSIRRYSRACRR